MKVNVIKIVMDQAKVTFFFLSTYQLIEKIKILTEILFVKLKTEIKPLIIFIKLAQLNLTQWNIKIIIGCGIVTFDYVDFRLKILRRIIWNTFYFSFQFQM